MDLLPDPGTMGDSLPLPVDFSEVPNLTPTFPLLNTPMDATTSSTGTDNTILDAAYQPIAQYTDPANQSGSVATIAQNPGGFDWENLFGGLVGAEGQAAIQDYQTIPAVTAAQLKVQGQQIQGQVQLASLGALAAPINMNSLFTILIWGGIAWAILSVLGHEGGR